MNDPVRALQGLVALVALVSVNAGAAMFTPGQPCNGCELEIFDHGGVMPTAKNAVFRVQNPQTPNGPALSLSYTTQRWLSFKTARKKCKACKVIQAR